MPSPATAELRERLDDVQDRIDAIRTLVGEAAIVAAKARERLELVSTHLAPIASELDRIEESVTAIQGGDDG